eukprot:scaffold61145_cov64-Phaeocystis_antarctica.AAC.4
MPPHRRPGSEVGGGVLDGAGDALALAEAQLGPASRPQRPARMQGSELGGQGALTADSGAPAPPTVPRATRCH